MASGHREVETKYDVDASTPAPDLADLPDVLRTEGPTVHRLEATYFDTADLALGRRGITLRRRTGGDDEGWHLKLPVEGARQEIHAPIGRSARTAPIALRRVVHGIVRDQSLVPVAVVDTERTAVSLLGDDALLAMFCDDRVTARRVGHDDEEHIWREWELEERDARSGLVKAATKRLRSAGGTKADHHSKFGRVMQLGAEPEPMPLRAPRKNASEHELLGHHLGSLRADLHRLDPLARADVPDAVHRLRIVCRRLRALLKTFDQSFDSVATEPVRAELKWFGSVLGRPRDLEVLRERLGQLVRAQPAHLLRDRPAQWIESQLRAARRAAHRDVLEAMASDRYFALVDALDSWCDAPPWTDQRDRSAAKRLGKALDREWKRMERAAAAARGAGEDQPSLHDVRKEAKRVRYAAEVLGPVLGSDARATGSAAKRVQNALGEHHDAVVTIGALLDLAAAARAAGRDTFTYGVLSARLEDEAVEHEQVFEKAWSKARKSGRR